jgi:hypothetical protein
MPAAARSIRSGLMDDQGTRSGGSARDQVLEGAAQPGKPLNRSYRRRVDAQDLLARYANQPTWPGARVSIREAGSPPATDPLLPRPDHFPCPRGRIQASATDRAHRPGAIGAAAGSPACYNFFSGSTSIPAFSRAISRKGSSPDYRPRRVSIRFASTPSACSNSAA